MSRKSFLLNSAFLGAVAFAALGIASAEAESVTKQCAAKWQAAKAANQTGGLTYLQFYSKCSADLKAGTAAAPAAAAPASPAAVAPAAPAAAAPPAPAAPTAAAPAARPAARTAPAAAGSPVFPATVNASYSNLKAGKARFQTCLDQYHANKDNGGNGGLTWIGKGQYYSLCNSKLKGG